MKFYTFYTLLPTLYFINLYQFDQNFMISMSQLRAQSTANKFRWVHVVEILSQE